MVTRGDLPSQPQEERAGAGGPDPGPGAGLPCLREALALARYRGERPYLVSRSCEFSSSRFPTSLPIPETGGAEVKPDLSHCACLRASHNPHGAGRPGEQMQGGPEAAPAPGHCTGRPCGLGRGLCWSPRRLCSQQRRQGWTALGTLSRPGPAACAGRAAQGILWTAGVGSHNSASTDLRRPGHQHSPSQPCWPQCSHILSALPPALGVPGPCGAAPGRMGAGAVGTGTEKTAQDAENTADRKGRPYGDCALG